jgi:hypothetical protein
MDSEPLVFQSLLKSCYSPSKLLHHKFIYRWQTGLYQNMNMEKVEQETSILMAKLNNGPITHY